MESAPTGAKRGGAKRYNFTINHATFKQKQHEQQQPQQQRGANNAKKRGRGRGGQLQAQGGQQRNKKQKRAADLAIEESSSDGENETQAKLQELQLRAETFRQQFVKAKQTIALLKAQRAAAAQQAKREAELASEKLREEAEELKGDNENLESALVTMKRELVSARAKVEELSRENADIKKELVKVQRQLQDAKLLEGQAIHEYKSIKARLHDATLERDRAIRETRTLSSQLQDAIRHKKEAEEALSKSQQKLKQLNDMSCANIVKAARIRDKAIAEAKKARADAEQASKQCDEAQRLLDDVLRSAKRRRADPERSQGSAASDAATMANFAARFHHLQAAASVRELSRRKEVSALRKSQGALLRLMFEEEENRSLGEASAAPSKKHRVLELTVKRQAVIGSISRASSRPSLSAVFSHHLKITFKDEPGVDQGGLTREFFRLFFDEVLRGDSRSNQLEGGEPASESRGAPLLASGDGTGVLPPVCGTGAAASTSEDELCEKYKLVGVMLARALAMQLLHPDWGDPVPAPLVPLVPLLAGLNPKTCSSAHEALSIWRSFLDPASWQSLSSVLLGQLAPEELSSIPMDVYLEGAPEASADGELVLTHANKEALIRRAAQWQLVDSRGAHIKALRDGFQGAIRETRLLNSLMQIAPEDLQQIVGGQPWSAEVLIKNIDFPEDKWRDHPQDRELLREWIFSGMRDGTVDATRFAWYVGLSSAPASGELVEKIAILPQIDAPANRPKGAREFRRFPALPRVMLPGAPDPERRTPEERRQCVLDHINKAMELAKSFDTR